MKLKIKIKKRCGGKYFLNILSDEDLMFVQSDEIGTKMGATAIARAFVEVAKQGFEIEEDKANG